jgi:hypothetical protein
LVAAISAPPAGGRDTGFGMGNGIGDKAGKRQGAAVARKGGFPGRDRACDGIGSERPAPGCTLSCPA